MGGTRTRSPTRARVCARASVVPFPLSLSLSCVLWRRTAVGRAPWGHPSSKVVVGDTKPAPPDPTISPATRRTPPCCSTLQDDSVMIWRDMLPDVTGCVHRMCLLVCMCCPITSAQVAQTRAPPPCRHHFLVASVLVPRGCRQPSSAFLSAHPPCAQHRATCPHLWAGSMCVCPQPRRTQPPRLKRPRCHAEASAWHWPRARTASRQGCFLCFLPFHCSVGALGLRCVAQAGAGGEMGMAAGGHRRVGQPLHDPCGHGHVQPACRARCCTAGSTQAQWRGAHPRLQCSQHAARDGLGVCLHSHGVPDARLAWRALGCCEAARLLGCSRGRAGHSGALTPVVLRTPPLSPGNFAAQVSTTTATSGRCGG